LYVVIPSSTPYFILYFFLLSLFPFLFFLFGFLPLSFSWGGVRLNPLDKSTTNWPIVPGPDDEYGAFDGMRIAWETEVLGENLPQHHSAHHKSHMT
jgi:hypothetical protein